MIVPGARRRGDWSDDFESDFESDSDGEQRGLSESESGSGRQRGKRGVHTSILHSHVLSLYILSPHGFSI